MMATGSVQPRRGVTPYKSPEGGPRFLSDIIIELGLAEEAHVNQAVETARSSGATVGQILVQEGRLSEDDLARALAARYGLNHIDLAEFDVDPEAANLLPPAAAQRYKAVPLAFEPDGSLLVAMADPSDSLALSDIAFMTHLEVQASVAAANLIADLASRLPLPPNESGGSRFPVPAPAPAAELEAAATAPVVPDAPPPAAEVETAPPPPPEPTIDTAEFDRLRAELKEANAALDSERSKHAEMVAELRHQAADGDTKAELEAVRAELATVRAELDTMRSELEVARSEREGARSEVETARSELEAARSERDAARSEVEAARSELEVARSERDASRSELEAARSERDGSRSELDIARSERDTARTERDAARDDLDTARAEREALRVDLERTKKEAEVNADAAQRAADAEARLAELGEVERRIAEAHSTLERMRNEFELEREGYAATERELRAKVASGEERREALEEAHAALQKRVEVLRTQNAALLDAYATAKRWSAEFARGAKELASTLEQPVLDDALRAQQNGGDDKRDEA